MLILVAKQQKAGTLALSNVFAQVVGCCNDEERNPDM